jgi:hypothetical protein
MLSSECKQREKNRKNALTGTQSLLVLSPLLSSHFLHPCPASFCPLIAGDSRLVALSSFDVAMIPGAWREFRLLLTASPCRYLKDICKKN